MPLEFQVLSLTDIDEIYQYADARLALSIPDPQLRTFESWTAKWRRESLEHYLPLGWSFIVRENQKVVGYFLGQPFLFFRGQTQTLWIEHLEANSPEIMAALADVAVGVAREKHFQRVLFAADLRTNLEKWRPSPVSDVIIEIKTSKG